MLFWTRQELKMLMRVYGRMVILGEWKDYALSGAKNCAVFEVFKHTALGATYRVEKREMVQPYRVTGSGGQVLRRGKDMEVVLRAMVPKRLVVIADRR